MKKNALLFMVIVLSIMMGLLGGCNEKRKVVPPEMFPVSGNATTASGQIPVGYAIMLNPSDMDLEKAATGAVQEDGSFVLHTNYMGECFDGVIPGKYRVAVGVPYEKGGQIYDIPQVVDVTGEMTNLTIKFPAGN